MRVRIATDASRPDPVRIPLWRATVPEVRLLKHGGSHAHVAVGKWSERVEEPGTPGSPPPGTFYVAHYIQCRCGQVFVSRSQGTTKALWRGHHAQLVAEKNARSGFDAATARKEGHAHGNQM
jgi:hypothetical protein